MIAALLATCLSAPQSSSDDVDKLVFADGKEQTCRVLLETDFKVVYRAKNKTSEVSRAELKDVESVERSLHAYLTRFESLDAKDTAALGQLALFAEAKALAGEERNTWLRIL